MEPAPARLIPAHAGKTAEAAAPGGPVRAHPRSRGENQPRCYPARGSLGSSPLTRGKLNSSLVVSCCQGLIPAHAGKTRRIHCLKRLIRAHPRSRGENVDRKFRTMIRSGSSPLTRGKPRARRPRVAAQRLIPAHAGKTLISKLSFRKLTAHPRSRGENPNPHLTVRGRRGSSPLTRGKLIGS